MTKVLITGESFADSAYSALLSRGYEVEWDKKQLIPPAELRERLEDVDAYILAGNGFVSADMIQSSHRLRFIGILAAVAAAFADLAAAKERNVYVTATPGVSAPAVAEMTIGLMIAARRRIIHFNNSIRAGSWGEEMCGTIVGKTLGIVGLGAIGTQVAQMAHRGFGMKILYHSTHSHKDLEKQLGCKQVSLTDLLRCSDVVSLHCPLTEQTKLLIGKNELSLMQPGSILVNTSRAWLVDPDGLFESLSSDHLAAAAFDVYHIEPTPLLESDPYRLLSLPDSKFILTPHTAYYSRDVFDHMSFTVVDKLIGHFQ